MSQYNRNKTRSKYDDRAPKTEDDLSGFVDINQFYDKATDVKIKTIDKSIESLKNVMKRYIDDCTTMWKTEILPFKETKDCMILQNLSYKDYSGFLEYMKDQRPYKIMLISMARLEARKEYIIKKEYVLK